MRALVLCLFGVVLAAIVAFSVMNRSSSLPKASPGPTVTASREEPAPAPNVAAARGEPTREPVEADTPPEPDPREIKPAGRAALEIPRALHATPLPISTRPSS